MEINEARALKDWLVRNHGVTILRADDWVALYQDGMKLMEGHSLDLREVLHTLDIPCRQAWVEVDEDDPMESFPDRLP